VQQVALVKRSGRVSARWKVLGVASILVVAVLAVMWALGERLAAHAIVDAPNAGQPVPEPVAGELRVATGPPEASIAYEVDGA